MLITFRALKGLINPVWLTTSKEEITLLSLVLTRTF